MHKTVKFNNSIGDNLVGALHASKVGKKAVAIAHGFTSNKDRTRHIQLADKLQKAGITAFRIDFGGSGESDDRGVTIKAEIDDLLSAVKLLKKNGYKTIGILGESLGGIVALKSYCSDVQAMVLWAPVTKARKGDSRMDENQLKNLKDKGYYIIKKDNREFRIPLEYLKERENINRNKVLSRVKIPVMIVHGIADDTIPIEDSEEAIKILPKGSKLEVIDNQEHGDHKMDESMDIIIPKTVSWFEDKLQ